MPKKTSFSRDLTAAAAAAWEKGFPGNDFSILIAVLSAVTYFVHGWEKFYFSFRAWLGDFGCDLKMCEIVGSLAYYQTSNGVVKSFK